MKKRIINLIIIADKKCSTSKIYLHYLKKNNFYFDQLWLIDFSYKENKKNKNKIFCKFRFIYDYYIKSRFKTCFDYLDLQFIKFCEALQKEANFDTLNLNNIDLKNICRRIRYFNLKDYSDPFLTYLLKKNTKNAFLYTNGGIVPKDVININNLKIIHIHPGIVPEFRGSDCLLWSAIKIGKIGASCFYMNENIDEGDLISSRLFKIPSLPSLIKEIDSKEEKNAYLALLYSIDPHYRAKLLIEILNKFESCNLKNLPTKSQKKSSVFPYLQMHPKIREIAMRKFF